MISESSSDGVANTSADVLNSARQVNVLGKSFSKPLKGSTKRRGDAFLKKNRKRKVSLSRAINKMTREILDNPELVLYGGTVFTVLCLICLFTWVYLGYHYKMPGIWVYNLLHMSLSTIASAIFYVSFEMINMVEDCNLSVKLGWRFPDVKVKGVTLTDLGDRAQKYIPYTGTKRLFHLFTLTCLALSIWALSFFLEWEPTSSTLGMKPCIPATYNSKRVFTDTSVAADAINSGTLFSEIYLYGLPLSDGGLIGGFSAWPLSQPTSAFIIQSQGPVYVIHSTCADPVQVSPFSAGAPIANTKLNATVLPSTSSKLAFQITTTYPQGSVADISGTVSQTCNTEITFGSGVVSNSFYVDEWEVYTEGYIEAISVGSLNIVKEKSKAYSSVNAIENLSPLLDIHKQIVNWTTNAITFVLNNEYEASPGGSYCALMEWSVQPGGLYDTSINHRGVTAAVAAVLQYLTQFFDQTERSTCLYTGNVGEGYITYPDGIFYFYAISILLSVGVKIGMLIIWAVNYYRNAYSMVVVFIIRHPLLLARDLKHVMMEQRRNSQTTDGSERDFHRWASKKVVVYGELAKSPIRNQLGFGVATEIFPANPSVNYFKDRSRGGTMSTLGTISKGEEGTEGRSMELLNRSQNSIKLASKDAKEPKEGQKIPELTISRSIDIKPDNASVRSDRAKKDDTSIKSVREASDAEDGTSTNK